MEANRALYKSEHLLKQERYAEAQKEVQSYLATDPESIAALLLLAQTHLGLKEHENADKIVDNLVQLDPSDPDILYFKGLTQALLGKRKEALKFLDNALAYNPLMPEAHGLKAVVFFEKAEFEKSLEAANAGLEIDPENEMCLNHRSRALLKLGHEEEQMEADHQALKSNPMNPHTHASVGYSELQKGNYTQAKDHFREALRLDPNNEFARHGILQTIKATNLFYRLFLKYVFWMQGLKPQMRWAVVIIGYLLIQGLNKYAGELGALTPVAELIIVLYMIFAISTWIIGPVSNIFLRFHSFGKLVLSNDEIKTANICAVLMTGAIIGAVLLFSLDDEQIVYQNLGIYMLCTGIAMTVVISSFANATLEKSKRNLKLAGTIFGIGCALLLLTAVTLPGLALRMFNWLIYGFIGYQFFANSQE
ncbi:MAG: tetratricopeptide repeat protein [Reichenbachiella sp.]|uniref:tetratricopeptide repeat protein n=1 Tax=Reichenbachiella sp. TaxID=2184521 RepID=UPI00326493DE